MGRERGRQADRQRERGGERDRDRDRQTDRQTETGGGGGGERDRQTDRNRETGYRGLQHSRQTMLVAITLSLPGSSAGIGAGMAVYLAARGARLSLTGRDVGKLKVVAQRCVEAGLKETDVRGVVPDTFNISGVVVLYHWQELPQVKILSRQNKSFVATKQVFCRDKSMQTYFCRDKTRQNTSKH